MKTDVVPSYNAKVLEVISGDDLTLMVELGIDDLFKKVRARLRGVDTPSAYKQDGNAEAGQVRADVRRLTKGRGCRIDVHSQGGRGGWVVTLYVVTEEGELELNAFLREKGFVYAPKEKEDGHTASASSH